MELTHTHSTLSVWNSYAHAQYIVSMELSLSLSLGHSTLSVWNPRGAHLTPQVKQYATHMAEGGDGAVRDVDRALGAASK